MPLATFLSNKDGRQLNILKVGYRHVPALESIEARSNTVRNEQISFHIELQRTSSKFIAAALLPHRVKPETPRGSALKTALHLLRRAVFSITTKREAGEIVAFAGMSFRTTHPEVVVITTAPDWRRQGIADVLMLQLLEMGKRNKANRVALEVRKSNLTAQELYKKYLYEPQKVLPKHYTDNDEDAIYMHTPKLHDPNYEAHLEQIKNSLHWRPI